MKIKLWEIDQQISQTEIKMKTQIYLKSQTKTERQFSPMKVTIVQISESPAGSVKSESLESFSSFTPAHDLTFTWGDLNGKEVEGEIDKAYDEVVHRRRNKIPSKSKERLLYRKWLAYSCRMRKHLQENK